MIPDKYNPEKLTQAIQRGGINDLRFACDLADRVVNAAMRVKDEEILSKGFVAFRARLDYEVDEENNQIQPLAKQDLCAPPQKKTPLGRFNAIREPALYLSATREVALAEVRAVSTDICTVATFQTVSPLKIAKLLRHNKEPLGLFLGEPHNNDDLEMWLLARTAAFVSRRVNERESELHYRACNLIGSAFKSHGYDGLAYRTSFWSDGWRDTERASEVDNIFAANIVFFDPKAATPRQSNLFKIDWKRPVAEIAGNSQWNADS